MAEEKTPETATVLASFAHDLRSPLNAVIGFSRIMLKGIDGPLNDLQSQDLETIHESGQHLLGLINNILDMSKIEAGKMELQMDYTDLEEIVDAAVTTGHGLVQDKPIEFVKVVDPGLPSTPTEFESEIKDRLDSVLGDF